MDFLLPTGPPSRRFTPAVASNSSRRINPGNGVLATFWSPRQSLKIGHFEFFDPTGSNRELLKRIGRFQREFTWESVGPSQKRLPSGASTALILVINSLHSLQPSWMKQRTLEANQTGTSNASDTISSTVPATETRRDRFSFWTRRAPIVPVFAKVAWNERFIAIAPSAGRCRS